MREELEKEKDEVFARLRLSKIKIEHVSIQETSDLQLGFRQAQSPAAVAGSDNMSAKTSPEVRMCERDIWLLEGILKHGLSYRLLDQVRKKF